MITDTFHDIHKHEDGVFNTASGRLINIYNPEPDSIILSDIANSLSKICRFGGHIHDFYSVAQHSVLVAAMADSDIKMEALMHDAAEAFVGDMIKPLKTIIGKQFDDIEDRFMQIIVDKFELDMAKMYRVKEYDLAALSLEHNVLQMQNPKPWHTTTTVLGVAHRMLPPVEAKAEFLLAFKAYAGARLYAKIVRDDMGIVGKIEE